MTETLLSCLNISLSDFLTSSSLPLEIRSTSSKRSSKVIPLHIFHNETAVSLTRYPSPFSFIKMGVPSLSFPTEPLRRIILSFSISLVLFNNSARSALFCTLRLLSIPIHHARTSRSYLRLPDEQTGSQYHS